MSDYIEYVANCFLTNLDLPMYYNKRNPVGARLCHRDLGIRGLTCLPVPVYGYAPHARPFQLLRARRFGVQQRDTCLIVAVMREELHLLGRSVDGSGTT